MWSRSCAVVLLCAFCLGPLPWAGARKGKKKISWKRLQKGLHFATISTGTRSKIGDNRLQVVRVEPKQVRFRVLMAQRLGGGKRQARQWAQKYKLAVAVNLGMFQKDHRSHVGYMRYGKKVMSRGWRRNYLSMLAIGPRKKGLPRATVLDLDKAGDKKRIGSYAIVAQNLRLIKRRGKRGRGVWSRSRRRWSEMLLALDGKGRIYLIFCRTPFSMRKLNRILLSLPLGIVKAMHLEGGPEASLSIRSGSFQRHFTGSYETSFNENDKNRSQWPIPNVLGIVGK